MSEGVESSELEESERSTANAMTEAEAREGYKWVQLGPTSIEIPEEWEHVYFNDAITLNPSCELPKVGPVDFLPMDAVNESNRSIDYWTQRERENCTTTKFENDDTVYGKITPCAENGKIAQIKGVSTDVGSGSTEFLVFRGNENRVIPNFVFYLVNFPTFRDVTISLMEGSTGRQRIPTDIFKRNLKIPIPSLPEQRRIAEFLSTVDEQIQQTDEIIEKRIELRDGLLKDILHTGIGDNEIAERRIGPKTIEIPSDWDTVNVESLLPKDTDQKPLRGGPPGGKIHKRDRVEGGYRLYTQEVITKRDIGYGTEYISSESFEELKRAEPVVGDILITRAGTVGEATVFPADAERGIIDSALMRLRVDTSACNPQFLSLLVDKSYLVEFQIRAMSQSGVIRNLNNRIIKQLQVPLPPLEEQNEIVNIVSTAGEKIELEKERKRHLQELKRGLMQDLLTGTVRVPESIEVED